MYGRKNTETVRASPLATTSGFPFVGTLLDGHTIGSFCPLLARAIGTGDTVLAHGLGRVPQGYEVIRNQQPAVVYDGTAFGVDWTRTTLTLRASVATIASLLVF